MKKLHGVLLFMITIVLYKQYMITKVTIGTVVKGPRPVSESKQETSIWDQCQPKVPCSYPDVMDLRLIIITYNRPQSLARLLNSLNKLELDGDSGGLEIWIDRSKLDNSIDEETLKVAQEYDWRLGPTRVHIQKQHVGIMGQWIDSWRPGENTREIALLLEDDMIVSPFCWKWLKGVFQNYKERTDMMGATLRCHNVFSSIHPWTSKLISSVHNDILFMYWVVGPWGFAPHPKVWRDFQDWFHHVEHNSKFEPFIGKNVVFDAWYKSYKRTGKTDSVWTNWFMYYTENVRGHMYCIYPNFNNHFKKTNLCLGVNTQEDGLHFKGRQKESRKNTLLQFWNASFLLFPNSIEHINIHEKHFYK